LFAHQSKRFFGGVGNVGEGDGKCVGVAKPSVGAEVISLLDQRIWPINQRQANAAYHIAGVLVRKTLAVHQIDICQ